MLDIRWDCVEGSIACFYAGQGWKEIKNNE